VRIVKHAMEIIHLLTDENPVQVVVNAIINRWAQQRRDSRPGARRSCRGVPAV
jgi:ribosomal protein S7